MESLIRELGGVPLRQDRDINVEYVTGPDGNSVRTGILATDGTNLFCAAGIGRDGRTATVIRMFDTGTQIWSTLDAEFGRVSDLTVHDTVLWVATMEDGLRKYDFMSGKWTSFTTENGLPDNRTRNVVVTAAGVFAGIGTSGAGGVIRIDSDGQVDVLESADAPRTVPTFMAAATDRLFVTTQRTTYELDLESGEWTTRKPTESYQAVFTGKEHIWTSRYRKELAPLDADDNALRPYQSAWFSDQGKAGYRVAFVVEHAGQIWFGGTPWERFRSSGFYRLDPRTGEFRMYNPRDGFRMNLSYSTSDGVVAGDCLWVATAGVLARITLRSPDDDGQTPAEIRHRLFLDSVTDLEVNYNDTDPILQTVQKPLLRQTSSRSGRFTDSELYIFQDKSNIPRLIATASLRHTGNLFLEIASLSDTPLWGRLPRNDHWRAESGGSGRQSAQTQSDDQTQVTEPAEVMRQIAESVHIQVKAQQWKPADLLPEPLYRYTAPDAGVPHGAVFGFGEPNDPSAVLMVWQEADSEQWYWLAAASTSLPLRCSSHGRLIWQKDGYWSEPRTATDPYVEVMLRPYPELVD